MTARSTRSLRLGGLVLAAGLVLAGCSPVKSLAGVHPPPVEKTEGAPIAAARATDVATRVLTAAQQAEGVAGAEGDTARAAVLTGPALELAKARATLGVAATDEDALTRPDEAKPLAVSTGRAYPRVLLTTTLDEGNRRQYLEVFVSKEVAQPYLLEHRVAMLPGATLPGVGEFERGTALVGAEDDAGLVMTPKAAIDGYAALLNAPTPTGNDLIDSTDAYATALKKSQAAQTAGLGSLASLAQTHTVDPESLRVIRLAGGGAVVLGKVNRVDTITAAETAKELKVPEPLQKLTGAATATKTITINAIESVAILVPAKDKGKVSLLGVVEQLVSGSVA